MPHSPIPPFYRISFLIIDPAIAIWGAYLNFFMPAMVSDAFVPKAISPYDPLHSFLNHQIGGALLMCAFLDIFSLRKTNDMNVWRAQQWGQLLYDVIILGSTWYSLGQQGRLQLANLRIEDVGGAAITGICGVVRVLFLANVGLKSGKGKQRRI